jgi:hypothetical protein
MSKYGRTSGWPLARLSCFKAGRKIRISGRLWMNSLDGLGAAAMEGAGIVRVPSRLASPKITAFVDYSSSAGAASFRLAHSPALADKQNQYSILKPCQMTVVYQAADQSHFIAS